MMTTQSPEPIQAKVREMLHRLTWETSRGAYLQNAELAILVRSSVADKDHCHVAITVLPQHEPARILKGMPVVVIPHTEGNPAAYGILNERGQILFRGLPQGSYEMFLPVVERQGDLAISRGLIPLPAQTIQMPLRGASEERTWRGVFENNEKTIRVIERQLGSGAVGLFIESPRREWHGRIVRVAWRPHDSTDFQNVLAVLRWDGRDNSCVAEVELGWVRDFDLAVPLEPESDEALDPQDVSLVREALSQHALTQRDRDAWKALLDADRRRNFKPEVIAAIAEVLGE